MSGTPDRRRTGFLPATKSNAPTGTAISSRRHQRTRTARPAATRRDSRGVRRTVFLVPVPARPAHDVPMFAHLKTTTRVTFASLGKPDGSRPATTTRGSMSSAAESTTANDGSCPWSTCAAPKPPASATTPWHNRRSRSVVPLISSVPAATTSAGTTQVCFRRSQSKSGIPRGRDPACERATLHGTLDGSMRGDVGRPGC